MAGLVVGITIDPLDDGAARPSAPRRRLRLHTGMRPGTFGEAPAYGFVLQDDASPPASDSVEIPGSPIVLTRGEPTEIVVHNRVDFPLGVHWHGLELESWADGVPSWSGTPGDVRPAIAPGDSFVVRMTPPRAGSFMYHVHSEPGHQLSQGLYGPFLVMEPGEPWDPETDRVFVLGSLGAETNAPAAVNGEVEPGPIELRAGTSYRLRFMQISPDDEKRVALLRDGEPVAWRAVAKDGAELPPSQARTVAADFAIRVGETFDFMWTPESPGDVTLQVHTKFDVGPPAFHFGGPPPHTLSIPVRVR
jgi:FtsP/CotA-like multicopper oxidase with cupredoxin domain